MTVDVDIVADKSMYEKHQKKQSSSEGDEEAAQLIPAVHLLKTAPPFFRWEVGVKEINTSPRTTLVKFEPLMLYCVVAEAGALTTTLSAKT